MCFYLSNNEHNEYGFHTYSLFSSHLLANQLVIALKLKALKKKHFDSKKLKTFRKIFVGVH
jgi:hypothetical protein